MVRSSKLLFIRSQPHSASPSSPPCLREAEQADAGKEKIQDRQKGTAILPTWLPMRGKVHYRCCRFANTTEKSGKKQRKTKQRVREFYLARHQNSLCVSMRAGLKKDPGIPNLFPLKEQLLKQLEEKKQQTQVQRERERELRAQERKRKRSLQGLQNDAQRRTREFEKKVSYLHFDIL